MQEEKFKSEINTLIKFFSIYCTDKHKNILCKNYEIEYKNLILKEEVCLCKECHNLLDYAIKKLQNCPHEIKPRCRKCPNPCYDKNEWKKMAKMMRYSGMKLGLLKVKNKFNSLLKKN
ncbi:nitrous oxide-stimulated promoter family protein [Caminibacter mediatlanticus TB-2]|uniref:Nitrous oxide-stimulated promoter family protein n=1 Tax=Caminibacter mediatlanticus TB-2 TaxID=391592 RepID=A0AAI9AGT5_9BACT|nr:nitrous oxide-stimulated promoter family protein [Caminibacter mediatlanticus]EDM23921.1 hypothetical protein CMTB2_06696 [Caminibacter mediatlanticus TB-2]QCT94286.1 nitrous oxide-stimulated promoter family protein [Caminibacter mediatlanticus TB-2]